MTDEKSPSAAPRGMLTVLLIAQLMANMDNSITTVATETLREDLHATGSVIQFVISGFTLAFAVLVVTGARLGGHYGHRRIFLAGLAGFTATSLACGLAPGAVVLVAGRGLQGGFAALMVPQVLSFIHLGYRGRARARAVGLYSMILALGVASGQIIGGLIVGIDVLGSGWRAAFLVNVPVGLVLFGVARRILPHASTGGSERLDVAGVAILGLSMTAFTAPLVVGPGHGWPWGAWAVLAAGAAGLAAFLWYERRLAASARRPLLDLGLLRTRGIRPGLLACCVLNFGYAGVVFTVTLYLQGTLHYGPLEAGVAFVPYPAGFATVSLTWARLPERVQRLLPAAGPLGFALALSAFLLSVQDGWPAVAAIALFAVAGAGQAAGYSPLVARISDRVRAEHASDLSAALSTGTLLSSVLSIAVTGGVFLAWSDRGADGARTGLNLALCLLIVLLLVAAACAARAVMVLGRGAPGGGDGAVAAAPDAGEARGTREAGEVGERV
ncbi:MFS transporter [Streptomyces hoynatensis]|uniref:MFS transporter n=1 Tax=Streptomyces hoynatensis TaxID=1141874 RepID=A0A3A9Z9H2_9ACTN|nr:MFS transporter [Streptomyces hoynatensis]RKN45102.1 MFS transporter [Streptomyces hoynatensis]